MTKTTRKLSRYELQWGHTYLDYLRGPEDDNAIRNWMFMLVFTLGFVLTAISDQIALGVIGLPAGWHVEFVANLLFNLGIVLWTSVVIVFLLEIVIERQRRSAREYLRQLEQELGEEITLTPEEQAAAEAVEAEQQMAALSARLDAIMTELEQIKVALAAKNP